MPYQARFVTEPIVAPLAHMELDPRGTDAMIEWLKSRAPACLPDDLEEQPTAFNRMMSLFPHNGEENGRELTHNELLVELAGRACYNSFGLKAGRKTNSEYIANMQQGDVPHRSVQYHAKQSFFIAGVSRRVSHELIRNYVGADRSEEGSPSQQSTRFVENPGFYIIPPKYLEEVGDPVGQGTLLEDFKRSCHENYANYRSMIDLEINRHMNAHGGERPKGLAYKRILEAASAILSHTVETSFIWTTNPIAIAKLMQERHHELADKEFYRFAGVWKRLALSLDPNLYPQLWMQLDRTLLVP